MRLNANEVVKDTLLAEDTLTQEAQGNLKADKVFRTLHHSCQFSPKQDTKCPDLLDRQVW